MPAAYPTPASLTPTFPFPAALRQRAVISNADFGPAAPAFGACCILAEISAACGRAGDTYAPPGGRGAEGVPDGGGADG